MGDKSLDSQEDAPVDRDGDSQEDFPVDRKRKTTIEQESRTKVRRKQAIVSSDEEMADKSRTIHSESEPEPEMLPEEPIRPFVSGSPPPQCRIQKQVPILSKKELAKIKKQKLLDAPDIGLKGSKKNHVYDSGDDCSADEIDFTGLRNMSKVVFAPIIVKPQLLIEDVEYDENIVNVKPFKKNAVVEGDIIPLVAYKKQDLFVKGFKILKQKREKQVKVYGTKKLSKTVKGGKVIGDEKLLIESSGDSDASIPVSGQSEDDEDDGVFSRPKTASNSARQSVDLNHSSRSRSQSLEIEEEEEDVVTKPKSKRAIIVDEDSEEDVAFTKKPKAKPAPKMKPATKSRSTIVIESDDSDDAVFKKPKPSQRLNR